MAHARKTLTQYADELEQWVAQGWLTGQETFIELQDMATLHRPDLSGSRRVAGGPGGDTRDQRPLCRRCWPRVLPPGAPGTILEALTPTLDAHPGMWPGMALYWLRRQAAS